MEKGKLAVYSHSCNLSPQKLKVSYAENLCIIIGYENTVNPANESNVKFYKI